jgi:Holliday junction resolvase RusA-like endonuclease
MIPEISGDFHVKKPDIDNLDKFLMDCCNGVVWVDDKQVAVKESKKVYSVSPCTELEVYEIIGGVNDYEVRR